MSLPSGWTRVRFGDLTPPDAPIIYGILQPGPDAPLGVPYVRPSEISNGQIKLGELRRTTPKIGETYARSTLATDDLILSIVGTIGKVASVPRSLEGGNITQSSCRIRPDQNLVSNRYLQHFLGAPEAVHQYDAKRLGTAVPRLNLADVREFILPLPPFPEQRRIVAKLDALTARLARARAEISKAADNQRRLKAVCYEAAIATDAGEQTLACVLTDVRYGTAQKCGYDGATPVLRIPNVAHGEIDFSDLKSANFEPKEIKALSLAVGDVLIVRSNGSLELVGRSALVDEKAAGMLYAGYLIRLRLDPTKALPTYVQLWLSAPSTRAVIEGLARSSSGVNNINSKQLQALRIRLPDLETQKAKVATAMAAFARADRLEAEAQKALALIDRLEAAILAMAFRGELVAQDPNDEPASVLLERIHERRAAEPKPKRGRRPKLAS